MKNNTFPTSTLPLTRRLQATHRLNLGRISRLVLLGTLSLACFRSGSGQETNAWKLVWSDEFDGAVGTPPDATKWKLQAGPGAALAGNEEAETYCAPNVDAPPCKANQPNAYLDGHGHLVIVAVKSDQTVTVGPKKLVAPVYTSARMTSVQSFRYGRLEASIRLPAAGKGIWPAFWALGEQSGATHWPSIGEIDVMEQWNPMPGTDTINPLTVHGAVHGPKTPGSSEGYIDLTGDYIFPGAPSGGLHQFAVEWGPGQVDFYVDGNLYESQSVATLTGKEVWEQDRQPFNLLLNLAMGGGFFGYPDASTGATPTMVVDYVRVYQRDPAALPSGWGNYDAGGPAEAGSAVFKNGTWTVAGGGGGISGRFDQFHFAYRGLGGDGEVTAHVIDQTSKLAQAQAGVMLRDARGAASPFAMMFVGPDGSVHFRYRGAKGDVPSEVPYKGKATWMKVGRVGDVFTGYASTDGKSWTAVGNTKLAMPFDATAGLIASARDNHTPNSVRFDYVDVTRTDAGYDGVAVNLPGTVQAEHFNNGGAGPSYSAEVGDAGLQVKQIVSRAGEESASGFYLAAVKAGTYINYSVFAAKEGDYAITARVSSAAVGGTFHFNIDQKPLSKPLAITQAGQWSEVKTQTFHMTAGHHTLALVTDSGAPADFDFFHVQAK